MKRFSIFLAKYNLSFADIFSSIALVASVVLLLLYVNTYVIASLALFVCLFHHRLPSVIWYPFEKLATLLWLPFVLLDNNFFKKTYEKTEVVIKNKFQKISSPIARTFLSIIVFVLIIGDLIAVKAVRPIVNWMFNFKIFEDFGNWLKDQHIIVLRIFIGIPFIFMEIAGLYAGYLIAIGEPIAIAFYLGKFLFVIPFNYINRIGEERFKDDKWYLGFKYIVVTMIDAVKNLGAFEKVTNKYNEIKFFIKDSDHDTVKEIKIRIKLLKKVFEEIFELRHIGKEFKSTDEIDLIFISPKAHEDLVELYFDNENPEKRKVVIEYIIHEIDDSLTFKAAVKRYVDSENLKKAELLQKLLAIKKFSESGVVSLKANDI